MPKPCVWCVVGIAVLTGVPQPAEAQKVIGAPAFRSHPILLSASGGHVVGVTPDALVPDDTDSLEDVYLFTVSDGEVRRIVRTLLVGLPEPAASASTVELVGLSGDGRYLGLVTRPRLPGGGPAVLSRIDLLTSQRVVIRDAAADPFATPTMSRDGSTFAWIGANGAVLVERVGETPIAVGIACVAAPVCGTGPALTADGSRVFYIVDAGGPFPAAASHLESFDVATHAKDRFDAAGLATWATRLRVTGNGSHVLLAQDAKGQVLDVGRRQLSAVPVNPLSTMPAISDDALLVMSSGFTVYDRRFSITLGVAAGVGRALSADGRVVAGTLSNGDFVVIDLDGDADGMSDPWETVFRLSPGDPSDAADDPDADGVSNLDEYRGSSHPRGLYRKYFAEGVESAYFRTRIQVFRPSGTPGDPLNPVVVTFLGDDGSRGGLALTPVGQPQQSEGVAPSPLLTTTQFSVLVESDMPTAAERITTWGPASSPRGSHASSGQPSSTEWHFAEGATISGLQLFYLLLNPGGTEAIVDIDYLLAAGGMERRRHLVPPGTRRTIWVNQEGGALGAAEVGARITATVPIVAERAMYLPAAGGFAGGTASLGVTAPATTWHFAEGATSGPFDMFVLLGNPGTQTATVSARYMLEGGTAASRTYEVPAGTRRTIWVDQDAALAQATFGLTLTSSTAIVAERAMWWTPAGQSTWSDGHVEPGSTEPATRWAVADVHESAFLLLANPGDRDAGVRVRMFAPNGIGAAETVVVVPAGQRLTFWPTQAFPALPPDRYSALLESLPGGDLEPRRIVVERASYGAGVRVGNAVVGTPLP